MANTNLRKAAVFLSSLPKPQAAKVLEKLDPARAAAVTAEMAGLSEIDRNEQETACREIAAAYHAHAAEEPAAATAPFHFLQGVSGEEIARTIAGEHPQTVALVLSHLAPKPAAEVLTGLPPDVRLSAVRRMAAMQEPSLEIIRDVETGLRLRFDSAHVETRDRQEPRREKRPGVAAVVRMFNAMKPSAERALLRELAEADPMLLRDIRRAMFGPDVADYAERDLAEAS